MAVTSENSFKHYRYGQYTSYITLEETLDILIVFTAIKEVFFFLQRALFSALFATTESKNYSSVGFPKLSAKLLQSR